MPRYQQPYHCMERCRHVASGIRYSLRPLLDYPDFLFGQAVEFVDELVDLLVDRVDFV